MIQEDIPRSWFSNNQCVSCKQCDILGITVKNIRDADRCVLIKKKAYINIYIRYFIKKRLYFYYLNR